MSWPAGSARRGRPTGRRSPRRFPTAEKGRHPADYLSRRAKDVITGEEMPIALPKSNVLEFILGEQGSVIARPSGTEPKVKFYYTAVGKTKKDAQILLDAMIAQISI